MDFCFGTDFFVSCFSVCLPFFGWRLLLVFVPGECVPSIETGQLNLRSKVTGALSSVVRKDTHTQSITTQTQLIRSISVTLSHDPASPLTQFECV